MNQDELDRLKNVVRMEECQHGSLITKAIAHIEGQDKRIAELQRLNEDLMTNGNSLKPRAQTAEDRIADLEEDNHNWRIYNMQLDRKNRKLLAALKKLGRAKRERGKALVEERARVLYFCHAGDLMYDMDVLEESNKLKEKHMGEAREQLRREKLL